MSQTAAGNIESLSHEAPLESGIRVTIAGVPPQYFPSTSTVDRLTSGQTAPRDYLRVSGKNFSSLIETTSIRRVDQIEHGTATPLQLTNIAIAQSAIPKAHPANNCNPIEYGQPLQPNGVQPNCSINGAPPGALDCWDSCAGPLFYSLNGNFYGWCYENASCGGDPATGTYGGYGVFRFSAPGASCLYDYSSQGLTCVPLLGNVFMPPPRDVSGNYAWFTPVEDPSFPVAHARLTCGNPGSSMFYYFAIASGYTPNQSIVNVGISPTLPGNTPTTWKMATPYSSKTGITVFFYKWGFPPGVSAYCEGNN